MLKVPSLPLWVLLWSARLIQLAKSLMEDMLNVKVYGSKSAIFLILSFFLSLFRPLCSTTITQNGSSTHRNISTKLMLTTVWSSMTTHCLYTFKFTLVDKTVHSWHTLFCALLAMKLLLSEPLHSVHFCCLPSCTPPFHEVWWLSYTRLHYSRVQCILLLKWLYKNLRSRRILINRLATYTIQSLDGT